MVCSRVSLIYTFHPAVIGGTYPYLYEPSGAPMGITIDAASGAIAWTNPRASDFSINLTVLDAASPSASVTFGINVTAAGCQFVDAINGRPHPAGDGSHLNPWQTIADCEVARRAGRDHVFSERCLPRRMETP